MKPWREYEAVASITIYGEGGHSHDWPRCSAPDTRLPSVANPGQEVASRLIPWRVKTFPVGFFCRGLEGSH